MKYEPVIGLEVHAQLLTDSKIFCGCKSAYGGGHNTQTCPVCLGLPGALPVLNRRAVEFAMKMILAVGGRVNQHSIFARKNYFYPDLPKGYQVSQFDKPIGEAGTVTFLEDGAECSIGLIRIHLEEDAGKSFHPETVDEAHTTWVDMNRCGVPLIEIVSKPDIRSSKQAGLYLTRLREIVRDLEVCTGNMDEGALRCDANVSIRPANAIEFGTRTEVKNLNSIRSVERAIEYEIERQTVLIESGGRVQQQTLLWDEKAQLAHPMRSKEESSDYRYFPEPDLLPLRIDSAWIADVMDSMPEQRKARAEKLKQDYHLSSYTAEVLARDKHCTEYLTVSGQFAVKDLGLSPGEDKYYQVWEMDSNWLMTETMRLSSASGIPIRRDVFPIKPDWHGKLISLISSEVISSKIAKDVYEKMSILNKPPDVIINEEGITQISTDELLVPIVDAVIKDNPGQVEKYRGGKAGLFGFFVGETMKRSQGRANPKRVNELLKERLGEPAA